MYIKRPAIIVLPLGLQNRSPQIQTKEFFCKERKEKHVYILQVGDTIWEGAYKAGEFLKHEFDNDEHSG